MRYHKYVDNDCSVCIESDQLNALETSRRSDKPSSLVIAMPTLLPILQEEIVPRLRQEFFGTKSCIELAKALLGTIIVREIPSLGVLLKARIVETEAYVGIEDRASHTFGGKQTERNKAMFMAPGTAYVYKVYGMYECFNVSSTGDGAAVLLRALEPLSGIEHMLSYRLENRRDATKPNILRVKDLCNGPSKLCQAMQISKAEFDQQDLTAIESKLYFVPGDEVADADIVVCPRIGISKTAAEWQHKNLRFYIRNCEFVSAFKRN